MTYVEALTTYEFDLWDGTNTSEILGLVIEYMEISHDDPNWGSDVTAAVDPNTGALGISKPGAPLPVAYVLSGAYLQRPYKKGAPFLARYQLEGWSASGIATGYDEVVE